MWKLSFREVEELAQSHPDDRPPIILFQRPHITSQNVCISSGKEEGSSEDCFPTTNASPSSAQSLLRPSLSFLGPQSRLPGLMTDTPQLSNPGPWFSVFHTQNPQKAHLCIPNPGLSFASEGTVLLSWKDVSILLLHSPRNPPLWRKNANILLL